MIKKYKILSTFIFMLFLPSPVLANNINNNTKPIVPVKVQVKEQGIHHTISICNRTRSTLPLKDLEFSFNYTGTFINNLNGKPKMAWQVLSHKGKQVILFGGKNGAIKPDILCQHPLMIEFDGTDKAVVMGPYNLRAADYKNNRKFKDVPSGNSTWVYDTVYTNTGKKNGVVPGLFVNKINQYNAQAGIGHKLNQVFSYGGDMEMFCKGSGGSTNSAPCTEQSMQVYYNSASVAAYAEGSNQTFFGLRSFPIIDGVVEGAYLKGFNSLSQRQAAIYADNVAKLYCADDLVEGIQIDLEPFDIAQPGQAFFYTQIAKNLAGQHDGAGKPDPYRCVNPEHPNGRIFSIFTFSGKVTANLASILNQYNNGYVIDSLYDLGPKAAGEANTVAEYTRYVAAEVTRMIDRARRYGIKYQFGIPAAASVHEFESVNGKKTGFKQIDYVKAAIDAINKQNARQDPLFRGINLWAWNQRMFFGRAEFTPATPPDDVQKYLGQNL